MVVLPKFLQEQRKRGLYVNYCKDIGPYTKIIPTLKKYPNDIIITVDDDILYNTKMIENLIVAHCESPMLIHFNRGHRIKLNKKKEIRKYKDWSWETSCVDVSIFNFPTGVGGVLYPPNCFNDEVLNESVFLNICKYADDVWLKAMALYNGTLSKKVSPKGYQGSICLMNNKVQNSALHQINNGQMLNDIQIKSVFDKYDLYKFLE